MKIIDLLNKIANGEEVPKKIKLRKFEMIRTNENDPQRLYVDDDGMFFPKDYSYNLDEEIKILDKKTPEKIDMFDYFTGYDFGGTDEDLLKHLEINFETINKSINEIIDYLKNKEE